MPGSKLFNEDDIELLRMRSILLGSTFLSRLYVPDDVSENMCVY